MCLWAVLQIYGLAHDVVWGARSQVKSLTVQSEAPALRQQGPALTTGHARCVMPLIIELLKAPRVMSVRMGHLYPGAEL